MIRKFNVTVNGKLYEVETEEILNGEAQPIVTKPAQPAKPVAVQAPAAPAAPKKAVAAPVGGVQLKAPMPGTINAIKVSNGQTVKKGDVVLVLEAMKLENDIVAPADGKITVSCSKGDMVSSGDLLAVIA